MTDRYEGPASVPGRIGVRPLTQGSDQLRSEVRLHDHVLHHGYPRMVVHAMHADTLGGWAADRHADNDWVFTTDMSIRAPMRTAVDRIDGDAELLRVGRSVVSSACLFTDPQGRSLGYADVTYMRLPRRHGDPPKVVIDEVDFPETRPLHAPIVDAAGIGVDDPLTGTVSCELTEPIRNPAGALQGAVTALLVEYGGEVLVQHHLGLAHLATELDIRYQAMGRIGPMRTKAAWIGDPRDRMVRVRLFDDGNAGRLCATAILRYEPISPS